MTIKFKSILSLAMIATSALAGQMGTTRNAPIGVFIGVGGNYNSVNLVQNSSGLGISNLTLNGVATSRGIAAGTAAPFINTNLKFAPEAQIGIMKSFNSTVFYGLKFTYQYLNSVATNKQLYLPQNGTLQTFNPPGTSSLFGYAIADSVETTIDHDMNLLALLGKSIDNNKYVYLGAGPSLISLRSQNFNSIGYALINGQTLNVTGLVNYGSPTIWAWGGAAQLGMSYYLDSSWFMDVSYTYSFTGSYDTTHAQAFTNTTIDSGNTILTSGSLATKDTFKSTTIQSVNLSINKIFNF